MHDEAAERKWKVGFVAVGVVPVALTVAGGELVAHVGDGDEHEEPGGDEERPIELGWEGESDCFLAAWGGGDSIGHEDVEGDEDTDRTKDVR